MSRYLALFFMMQTFISPLVFSQVAKIVDMRGRVRVKTAAVERWRRPRLDMYLDSDAEIQTGRNSECTIAFDEDLENVITIKENSSITIESIAPGEVYLPKGRIFSLIENLAKVQEFQIRTPTAIAGVRGTGDTVETDGENTTVKCFEGTIDVSGSASGSSSGHSKDLGSGSGLNVGPDGKPGAPFELGDDDWDEWDDFRDYIDGLREDIVEGSDSQDPFKQLRDEQRDGFMDDYFEELRNENREEECGGQEGYFDGGE